MQFRAGLLDRLKEEVGRGEGGHLAGSDLDGGPKPNPALEGLVRRVQGRILDRYSGLLLGARSDVRKRSRLKQTVAQVLVEESLVSGSVNRDALAEQITDELVGYGPIEPFMRDDEVTEIMVNGHNQIFIEKGGRLELTTASFRGDQHVLDIIGRIVAPLGRRVDQAHPFVDARLPDGSRVNAIIPPLALAGPVLTIRKFGQRRLTLDDLLRLETLSAAAAEFLSVCVEGKFNIIVSGGTGSGKTTTLNVLSGFIPEGERIITIEDSAELCLNQKHVVPLESRPANAEGEGEIKIRHLVINALRMRPDRIVVGEVRGAEAFDMLQAMNTGHQGSLCTIHANSPRDALFRLENMVLMAAEDLPHRAVREQVRAAIDLIIQQARLPDGSRKMTEITLVDKEVRPEDSRNPEKTEGSGEWPVRGYCLVPVFRYQVSGVDGHGTVKGQLENVLKAGIPPVFVEKLNSSGLNVPEGLKVGQG